MNGPQAGKVSVLFVHLSGSSNSSIPNVEEAIAGGCCEDRWVVRIEVDLLKSILVSAEIIEGLLSLDIKDPAALISGGSGETKVIVGPRHVEDCIFVSDEGEELLVCILSALPTLLSKVKNNLLNPVSAFFSVSVKTTIPDSQARATSELPFDASALKGRFDSSALSKLILCSSSGLE